METKAYNFCMLTGGVMLLYCFSNFDGFDQSRSHFLMFVNSYHENQKMSRTGQLLLGTHTIR